MEKCFNYFYCHHLGHSEPFTQFFTKEYFLYTFGEETLEEILAETKLGGIGGNLICRMANINKFGG